MRLEKVGNANVDEERNSLLLSVCMYMYMYTVEEENRPVSKISAYLRCIAEN